MLIRVMHHNNFTLVLFVLAIVVDADFFVVYFCDFLSFFFFFFFKVMIGYMLQRQTGSIMTGSDEMAVELYAVTADGSIASNYSVRASRDDTWYPSGDTLICDGTQACYHGNYWDIITNDMSAEVSDPRIILAITVDFMYRRLDLDSGICSTLTALGIVIGYMMAGCCVCFCCFVISPRSWWGLDADK